MKQKEGKAKGYIFVLSTLSLMNITHSPLRRKPVGPVELEVGSGARIYLDRGTAESA